MSTDKPAAQPAASTWDAGGDFNTQIQYQQLNNDAFSYQITVNLDGETIAEKTLSMNGEQQLNFNIRPDLESKPVYGVVLLAPPVVGVEPDWQLLAAVAHDPADLGNYQILATQSPVDDLYKPIPGNVPTRVTDVNVIPYYFVGRLEMDFKDKDGTPSTYYGSATIIGAKAKDADTTIYSLLTAAHNVRDTTELTCFAVRFYPRENDQAEQPQAVTATAWYCPNKGTPIDGVPIADDYAVVRLETKTRLLPDTTVPSVVIPSDEDLNKHPAINLAGLYWWDENNGRAMYVGTGTIGEATPQELRYAISTRRGASGTAITLAAKGPLKIIGVHDKAGGAKQQYNIGHRITARSHADIQEWMA